MPAYVDSNPDTTYGQQKKEKKKKKEVKKMQRVLNLKLDKSDLFVECALKWHEMILCKFLWRTVLLNFFLKGTRLQLVWSTTLGSQPISYAHFISFEF